MAAVSSVSDGSVVTVVPDDDWYSDLESGDSGDGCGTIDLTLKTK